MMEKNGTMTTIINNKIKELEETRMRGVGGEERGRKGFR